MLLAIDIGNSNITLGVFDGESLIATKRMPSDTNLDYCQKLKQELTGFPVTDCIIASVVDHLDTIIKNAVSLLYSIQPLLLNNCHSEFISESYALTHTGKMLKQVQHDILLNILSEFPTLGADRIANVVAGVNKYSLPLIIVDLGTANTFDVIDENKKFLGGLIAPGIGTQLKSLNLMTSKLPLLNIEESPTAIANNTKDAILSGVIRGTACMISGMIQESEKELGQKATVIATGGLATSINKYMLRPFDEINPSLTLLGLLEIYKLNQIVLH